MLLDGGIEVRLSGTTQYIAIILRGERSGCGRGENLRTVTVGHLEPLIAVVIGI